nr:DUF2637 domain-containing protein [Pseudonocardiales bacterium]
MVTPGDRSHGSREDRLTLRCTALVGVCAAALNFSALSALAAAADYPHWLVWCYPVCVDAYGLTAARVWLRGVHSAGVTRWARGSSVFVLVISMAAAGLHAFTADGRLPTTLG